MFAPRSDVLMKAYKCDWPTARSAREVRHTDVCRFFDGMLHRAKLKQAGQRTR